MFIFLTVNQKGGKSMKSSGLKKTFTLILFTILASSVPAQTLELQQLPSDKVLFGLNIDKPFFHNNYNYSTWTATYRLFLNAPISKKINLLLNVPYIKTNYTYSYTDNYFHTTNNYNSDQKGFGNIFLGIQTNGTVVENKRSVYTFGVYLPSASKTATYWSIYSDYYYLPYYIPNSVGLYFNYSYHRTNVEGINYGLEFGPDFFIPTQQGVGAQLLLHYGITAGYSFDKLLLSAEFHGRFAVSGFIISFDDRFVNLIGLGAQWKGDFITPKVFYKIFLKKDISDMVSGVLGAGISFAIDK